jgi:hypothetical protein
VNPQFVFGIGAALMLLAMLTGAVGITEEVVCRRLVKQAHHAGKTDIAEWIKTSEACN